MMPEHIERAVRECCPMMRTADACPFVALGCCPAVETWGLAHRSWKIAEHSAMPRMFADQQPVVRVNL